MDISIEFRIFLQVLIKASIFGQYLGSLSAYYQTNHNLFYFILFVGFSQM